MTATRTAAGGFIPPAAGSPATEAHSMTLPLSSAAPRLTTLVLQRAGELGLSHIQRRALQGFDDWAVQRLAQAAAFDTDALDDIRERTGLLLLQTLTSWQMARVRALRRALDLGEAAVGSVSALARAA
jgi:hypothetical protein